MPNIKSKIKRLKTNEKARIRNKDFRSQINTALKKAYQAIEAKTAEAANHVNYAVKLLDKAVSKKIFHKNKSARLKSKLMKVTNVAEIDVKQTVPKKPIKKPAKTQNKTAKKTTTKTKPKSE